MSISLGMIAAVIATVASTASVACGICDEDRVAAVFDNTAVKSAVATKRHVAFFAIEGSLPATPASRRTVVDALNAGGAVRGTARVSLESASASAEFDPAKTSLEALRDKAGKRLAPKGLALTALRVVDEGGVLKQP